MGGPPEPVTGADTPGLGCPAALSVSTKGHVNVALCFCGAAAAPLPSLAGIALCCRASFDAPPVHVSHPQETALATPNYSYEKRQRELAKKRKAEEKKQKKDRGPDDAGSSDNPADGGNAGSAEAGSNPTGAPPATAG